MRSVVAPARPEKARPVRVANKKRKAKPRQDDLPIDDCEVENAQLQTDQLTIFEVYEEDTGRVVDRAIAPHLAQGFAQVWKDHHPSTAIRARLALLVPLMARPRNFTPLTVSRSLVAVPTRNGGDA